MLSDTTPTLYFTLTWPSLCFVIDGQTPFLSFILLKVPEKEQLESGGDICKSDDNPDDDLHQLDAEEGGDEVEGSQ